MIKKIILVLLAVLVVVLIYPSWVQKTKLIGGDKDKHGCLIAAGYSWCEAKTKCLRTWEEGCGVTDKPASRGNIPQGKVTCEAQKGEWSRFGLAPKEQCNLPTSDAGKTCLNQNECEGACVAELSQDDQNRITKQKETVEISGRCASWLNTGGCNAYVKDGKVSEILCID